MAVSGLDLDAKSLRDLFDGVSDLVQSVVPDGTIRFVNRTWLERLGYEADEVEGHNIFEFIHPESREHCMFYLQRLLAGEQVGLMETLFVSKAGESVHLEGKVTIAFENGMPVVTRGIFREVDLDRRDGASIVRLREQRRMFHSVLSILRANTSRSRADFLALVTKQVAEALGISRVGIWMFGDQNERIVSESLHIDGKQINAPALTLLRSDHLAYFEAIETKVPVRAEDAHTHPATRSFSAGYLTTLHIESMLDLPLRLGDEVIGVMCCESVGTKRAWTFEEEEFGMTVAAIVLIFLENERRVTAERELQQLNLDLERRVEERSRQINAAEQRLAYLMTSVSAVVFACEAGGSFRTTFVSPNIESQLGYPASHYLEDPHFWRDRVHPDDLPRAEAAMQKTLRDAHSRFEYRFRCPDGSYRWFRDDYTLTRDAKGNPTELIGSCIDIHEQRCAEQAAQASAADLRRLIDTANAPIFGMDCSNRITEWNACAERISGYQRADVLGKPLTDFAQEGQRAKVAAVFEAATHGRDATTFEFPLVTKDGRTAHLLLSASARRDANGAVVGMVVAGQDITEHREAQRRNLRAQRLESIGTLAGGVAHDVNNSLAPILLASGMVRERHPESADLVDLMESSARRGASMVQQLLTFARGVEGKRAPVSPKTLIEELERIVQSTFPKNIALRFDSHGSLPKVVGDSTQLHQVLLNLCVNARDAMPKGGSLCVETHVANLTKADIGSLGEGDPGPYLHVCIRDTGIGIAPEMLDRIFEPFFSTKSPEHGTGLGLSTTLGIVRSHGGFMRVRSQVGQGTEFSVYLPASQDAEPAVEIPSSKGQNLSGNGQTILVVDDEPIVRTVLQRLLTRMGFRVEAVSDARAGLTMLTDSALRIDVVITDLHMPGMDGLEFTREIRRIAKNLPVMLASGLSERADPAVIESLKFAALLNKPFAAQDLIAALQSALSSAKS